MGARPEKKLMIIIGRLQKFMIQDMTPSVPAIYNRFIEVIVLDRRFFLLVDIQEKVFYDASIKRVFQIRLKRSLHDEQTKNFCSISCMLILLSGQLFPESGEGILSQRESKVGPQL
jgi:hypothetical protein